MPRIPTIALDQGGDATRQLLRDVRARLGRVPHLYTTLANADAALAGYAALAHSLSQGRLSAQQREAVALVVGQANGCGYCLSAHSLLAKSTGLTSEQVLAVRRGEPTGLMIDPLAALTRELLQHHGAISDDQLQAARACGLDDGLLMEVVANVALNVLTNLANNLAGTDIDFPLAPPLR